MRVHFAASCAEVAGFTFVGASTSAEPAFFIHVQIQTGFVVLSQENLSRLVPVTSTVIVTGLSAEGKAGSVVMI